jgi:hypothetical protein
LVQIRGEERRDFNEREVRGEILILFMFDPREGKEGEVR